jgi:hypothetical protein
MGALAVVHDRTPHFVCVFNLQRVVNSPARGTVYGWLNVEESSDHWTPLEDNRTGGEVRLARGRIVQLWPR